VTDVRDLERRYRRWLYWYPASFRREHEDEILGVLLAGARDGQRVPDPMDCLDLMSNGLRMRLRQALAGSGNTASTTVPLLCLGALMELVAAIAIVATAGDFRASDLSHGVRFTDAQWNAVVAQRLEPVALAASAAAVVWLALTWGVARGHRSAALALAAFLGVNVLGLANGVAHGSVTSAPADTVIGVALCVVQSMAVALAARGRYGWRGRPRPVGRSRRGRAIAHE
jgi:hypothetical protein